MTYSVYIDHPDHIDAYDFCSNEYHINHVVSRKLGVKVEFVCNSYAKISNGDVFEVFFDNPEDATAFVLKCNYAIIDKHKVEQYKNKDKKRDLQGSPYF
jgi:hypothetical protein